MGTEIKPKEVRPRVLEELANASPTFSVVSSSSSLVQEPKLGCGLRESGHRTDLGPAPNLQLMLIG